MVTRWSVSSSRRSANPPRNCTRRKPPPWTAPQTPPAPCLRPRAWRTCTERKSTASEFSLCRSWEMPPTVSIGCSSLEKGVSGVCIKDPLRNLMAKVIQFQLLSKGSTLVASRYILRPSLFIIRQTYPTNFFVPVIRLHFISLLLIFFFLLKLHKLSFFPSYDDWRRWVGCQ